MLLDLKIKNLAVVEDAMIPFREGLNVLTGSTGAGKSIILTAVELLSGERAKKALIRRGAENLTIEGTFSVPAEWSGRAALGMDRDDEYLSIRREVTASGRSRIWINGVLSSLSAARETSTSLFELHGQHRQQELLDPSNHIRYLDSWGDYDELRTRTMTAVEEYHRLTERLMQLEEEERRHKEQEEFIRFQLDELEQLELGPGLEAELEKRLAIISNLNAFVSNLERARSLISDDEGSALDRVSGAEDLIASLAPRDESWRQAVDELKQVRITLVELSRRIGHALGDLECEPEDIEALQEKLAAIQRLKRKYRLDYEGLVRKRDELREAVRSLEEGCDAIIEAKEARAASKAKLVPLLEDLSRAREGSAAVLDREVTGELKRLGMKGVLFETRIESPENCAFLDDCHELDLSPRGWDRVEFMIRTNVGEDIHSLREVASGGELSRITLVLKKLQAEERGIPVLVFDEIDSGLGADMGGVVA
jgi:DNA repair protein RecN (Recombination protein N)